MNSTQAWKLRRREAGLCIQCAEPEPITNGTILCDRCRAQQRARNRNNRGSTTAWKLRRKEAGLCISCSSSEPVVKGQVCGLCKVKRRRYEQERRGKRPPKNNGASPWGHCAVCAQAGPLDKDHDHETGWIRGLLCRKCNIRLGFYEAILRDGLIPLFNQYLGKGNAK